MLDTNVSGAPGFVANKSQEFRFLDGKPAVTPEQLKLTDRLLVSVDKPGSSNPTLYKMSISSLFQFIEKSNADLSSLRGLGSNTILNTLTTSIEVGVDDGTITRMSGFDDGGFVLHGALKMKNDSDGERLFQSDGVTPIKTSSIEKVLNGFDIKTSEDSLLKLKIVGPNHSLEVSDKIVIGTNQLKIDTLSRFELEPNTRVQFNEPGGGLTEMYMFDQSLNRGASVVFNRLALTDTFNVEGNFTANSSAINLNGVVNSLDFTATAVTSPVGNFDYLEVKNSNFFPFGTSVVNWFNPAGGNVLRINELSDVSVISSNTTSVLELSTLDQSARLNKEILSDAHVGDNGYGVGNLNTFLATETAVVAGMTISPTNWTPNILTVPTGTQGGTTTTIDVDYASATVKDNSLALVEDMEVGYMWSDQIARPYIHGGVLLQSLKSSAYWNPTNGAQDDRLLASTKIPTFALQGDSKYASSHSQDQNKTYGVDATLDGGYMVDYTSLVPILVAANQKLKAMVDALETRVAALEP